MPPRRTLSHVLVIVFLFVGLVLIGFEIWNAARMPGLVTLVREQAVGIPPSELEHEKTREELVGRRLENEAKRSLPNDLASAIGVLAPLLIALSGAVLALQGYLGARAKERQDSAAAALSETLKYLVSGEARERMVAAARLQYFFTPDQADFHLQALTALVAAARGSDTAEVQRSLRLAAEQAFRWASPDTLKQVSWQAVDLSSINLARRDLRRLDLRDADLQDARLEGAKLDNADLTAARLQGVHLAGASLTDANLSYADLAGADLTGADLTGATIDDLKLLDLDLTGADLCGIKGDWRRIPWDQSRNWRAAKFDAPVLEELVRRYGPAAKGPRVLMLMWEIPPLVAGGTWTACYHLVRNLRRRGADVTVVVPWDRASILTAPFGSEVAILPLGIVPPQDAGGPYGAAGERGPAWSPYGVGPAFWSGYDGLGPARGRAPIWSAYGAPYGHGGAGSYGSYGPSGETSLAGSVLFRLIGEFRRRLERHVLEHGVDVIHAHDWVTFDAARHAAELRKIPWIAHLHSTEADRRPGGGDPLIERIERRAIEAAAGVVTPSRLTKRRVQDLYAAPEERVHVVPNGLSAAAVLPGGMGRFETKRVIFVGRLTPQKGIDRFCELAAAVHRRREATFEVFGDGEERGRLLGRPDIVRRGAIGWDRRGEAFRGASLVVVPSRAEPFGMVILEAMEHRVPVLYPADSGAAEVLKSGIRVRPDDIVGMTAEVMRLLDNFTDWETTVEAQAREIQGYPELRFEETLIALWNGLVPRAGASAGSGGGEPLR